MTPCGRRRDGELCGSGNEKRGGQLPHLQAQRGGCWRRYTAAAERPAEEEAREREGSSDFPRKSKMASPSGGQLRLTENKMKCPLALHPFILKSLFDENNWKNEHSYILGVGYDHEKLETVGTRYLYPQKKTTKLTKCVESYSMWMGKASL